MQIHAGIELVRFIVVRHAWPPWPVTGRPDPASWLSRSVGTETSTLRTGSNPAILVLLGDRLRPVIREGQDIRSIQELQQTAAAMLLPREFTVLSAAAAAEL